jgi:hypothetical protein
VLRRIFRHKREETIGRCRKLHNEAFHNLYFSTDDSILENGMAETRNSHKILIGKSEENKQLGKNSCRWEDINRIDLRGIA